MRGFDGNLHIDLQLINEYCLSVFARGPLLQKVGGTLA